MESSRTLFLPDLEHGHHSRLHVFARCPHCTVDRAAKGECQPRDQCLLAIFLDARRAAAAAPRHEVTVAYTVCAQFKNRRDSDTLAARQLGTRGQSRASAVRASERAVAQRPALRAFQSKDSPSPSPCSLVGKGCRLLRTVTRRVPERRSRSKLVSSFIVVAAPVCEAHIKRHNRGF